MRIQTIPGLNYISYISECDKVVLKFPMHRDRLCPEYHSKLQT